MALDDHITIGIETSCDESGIALYSNKNGLISNQLFSQISLHSEYGGVVPELASRDHIKRVFPLINKALNDAQITIKDLDGIAYTSGPGLSGALLVGSSIAKSLSWSLKIPAIGINHMEGHLLAPMIDNNISFPLLSLLVSGGHSMIVEVERIGKYRILGETLDDSIGEAFDKTSKILGLGYPGGPEIQKLAQTVKVNRLSFPIPMNNKPNLDFSFSGLKTYAMNFYTNNPTKSAEIAKAFEVAAIKSLINKCSKAIDITGYNKLVISGGVSANKHLREEFNVLSKRKKVEVFFPSLDLCTDNGAMIAFAGSWRLRNGFFDKDDQILINPRWSLERLSPIPDEVSN